MSSGMSRLFRSLTLSSGSHLNRDGGVGGASGSDAPDGIGTASLTPALGLGDEDDDSDWLDAGFASDDHHLMAVYHFANVLAFEFGHDKAKETIERDQRDCLRTVGSPFAVSKWQQFFGVLAQFAAAEKQYMAMGFLAPKGFLRRENSLKTIYESMASELEKLDMYDDMPVLAELSSLLRLAAKTRLKLIAFYERLHQLASASAAATAASAVRHQQQQQPTRQRFIDFSGLRKELRDIVALHDLEYHGCLRPLRSLLRQECIIVGGYLGCLAELDHWRFNIALAPMTEAKRTYDKWVEAIRVWRDSHKASAGYGGVLGSLVMGGEPAEPHLFQWMGRLRAAVSAKYTLYFYQRLEAAAPSSQMFTEKLQQSGVVNYAQKLQHFQKRQDALHVGLIFDGASDSTYTGPGFQIASRGGGLDGGCAFPPSKRPSGMDLYPSAFFCPGDKEHLSLMKKRHWPSLVMTIAGMSEGGGGDNSGRDVEEAREGGRRCTVYVYDQRTRVTYFVHRVDPFMYLIAVFDYHRSEADPAVRGFLTDVGGDLRCARVLASIKPGNK